MKRLIAIALFLAPLPAYAGKAKEARLQMESDISVCNQQYPVMRGNMASRARCIGIAQLKRDAAVGANPQPTLTITNRAVEVWSLVDQGKMAPQDAAQQIQMLGAQLQAQQNYQQRQDDQQQNSQRWSNGVLGLRNGLQNYQNSLQQNQMRPQLNCTTMPMGAGQTATHCY